MYLGEQLSTLSDRRLALSAQLGVEHIALHVTHDRETDLAVARPDGTWDPGAIREVQRHLARHGLTLDVLALDVEQAWWSLLTDGPDRAAHLARLRQNIAAAAEAGVPCLKYRLQPIGVLRTGRVPGRGGARYAAFDVGQWTDETLTPAGRVSEARLWEVIAEFLAAVVPAAAAAGVRLAFHPQDPALPPEGVRGIPHVVGSVAALQRFLDLSPSPVHGLNFCQGTVAEMCPDPAKEVPAAIRTFGAQGKIFMVHFRNIIGGRYRFAEVYPDNGAVDMLEAMRAYKAVGYQGMFCPDHVPQSDADPGGERQFAFCLGYTRALIQAVEADGPAAGG